MMVSFRPSDPPAAADAATVVRDGRHVLDGLDLDAGGLHGADGRFPPRAWAFEADINVPDAEFAAFVAASLAASWAAKGVPCGRP